MAEFRFTTSGAMHITVQGLAFGRHLRDPQHNVKTFIVNPHQITLTATNQNDFTDWGVIELIDQAPGAGILEVTIDSPSIGWYGTAQFAIWVNGQNILNDNFQSGVKGPFGDPRQVKRYRVENIG